MARIIKCNRCDATTDQDYTSLDLDVPADGSQTPVKMTSLFVTSPDGEVADLCLSCARVVANVAAEHLRLLTNPASKA